MTPIAGPPFAGAYS